MNDTDPPANPLVESKRADHASRLGKLQEYNLARSGMRPLIFVGTLLAVEPGDEASKRCHELAIFQTQAGKYVASVRYNTLWEGETPSASAFVADTLAGAVAWLEGYPPTKDVRGFPLGVAFEQKQKRLLADIQARFAGQVSRLLGSLPEAAERIS